MRFTQGQNLTWTPSNYRLPSICSHKHKCQVAHEAYIVKHPEQICLLSIICHQEFNQVPMIQDKKQHKKPVRIQAQIHLVLQPEEVLTVACNSTYDPIFVAADEHMLLSTNPVVQIESITLHHLEQNYLHLSRAQ